MSVNVTAAVLGDPHPNRLARAEALRRRLPTPTRRLASRREAPVFSYDSHAELLYVRLSPARVAESTEAGPGVVLDLDVEGNVVGVELQNVGTPRLDEVGVRRTRR